MNVVGKFGSLISQGVYSIATPIHPFGGAVDVIVVQQQDGTFRSTPWYVQFGKFQGVLKGAEKIVRVTVNGIEANFHMYLDNSGEAYFIREVDSAERSELEEAIKDSNRVVNNNDACVSDYGADNLERSSNSPGGKGIQRVESSYYEFDDENFLEDSYSLSEDEPNLNEEPIEETLAELQGMDSEVILVSVDGHLLKAPVSASDQETGNVQLNTPRFNLGPGERPEYREGHATVTSAEGDLADYTNKLGLLKTNGESSWIGGDTAVSLEKEPCRGDRENAIQCPEALNVADQDESNVDCDPKVNDTVDSEDKKLQFEAETSPETAVSKALPEERGAFVEGSNEKLPRSSDSDSPGVCNPPIELQQSEKRELANGGLSSDTVCAGVIDELELKDEGLSASTGNEEPNGSLYGFTPETAFRKDSNLEAQAEGSAEDVHANARTRFEISLCGSNLHKGMGLSAAAQVFDAYRISPEEYKSTFSSILKDKNLIVRIGERYLTWEKAAPLVLGAAAFGMDLPGEPNDAIPVEQDESAQHKDDKITNSPSSSRRTWRLWPIPFRRAKTLEHTNSSSSSEDVFLDTESDFQNQAKQLPTPRKQLIRTNVPTSEQVASLNLKDGQNVVSFSFTSRILGSQQVEAYIYLWKWNARIVISDVDGTITKSDVLGQVMPLVGRDWTQSGVATLFSAIKENGYHLLFLSARAIVQAYLTRNFLLNLKQDGKALPSGPVVISPDGLFPSLYREVIRRAPHEFKIACLEDVKKLFPPDHNPFYAGFGNRDTDELTYMKMGIPKGKIFIINPKGEVATSHRIGVKSYTSLHTLVNDMFPPTSLVEQVQEDYNSWNFWKLPIPQID